LNNAEDSKDGMGRKHSMQGDSDIRS